MLNKEYNQLLNSCIKLQSATKSIRKKLDSILSCKDKSFLVSFDGVSYNFFPPTTLEEKQDLMKLKKDFISKLLIKSYEDMIQSENNSKACWDNILAFAMGNPIESYQIEKIQEENVYSVTDSNIKEKEGVPLNTESVYVQWQDENKIKFN